VKRATYNILKLGKQLKLLESNPIKAFKWINGPPTESLSSRTFMLTTEMT